MTHWDYSNPLLLYCTRTESVFYSCGGCCPLPRPNPPLCNTQYELVSFQSLKISIDKWALGYNKTWHPLSIWNTLLTNWNSVAAPAPASAFLSAPAKRTESMIIRQVEIQVIYIKVYHLLQCPISHHGKANISIGSVFPYWCIIIERNKQVAWVLTWCSRTSVVVSVSSFTVKPSWPLTSLTLHTWNRRICFTPLLWSAHYYNTRNIHHYSPMKGTCWLQETVNPGLLMEVQYKNHINRMNSGHDPLFYMTIISVQQNIFLSELWTLLNRPQVTQTWSWYADYL